jgi:translation elongation factor P/translation initiation factor 5A
LSQFALPVSKVQDLNLDRKLFSHLQKDDAHKVIYNEMTYYTYNYIQNRLKEFSNWTSGNGLVNLIQHQIERNN